jgi:histidinol-phosphate aminotransferase
VREALACFDRYHRYPDPEQNAIRPAVAAYAGVDPDRVILGNGSDELIDLLCRIYLDPGDATVDCTPTFGMYLFSTELCGGQYVEVPRTADWHVDVAAVERALSPRTKLIFVATPNNPTGNATSEAAVRALLATGRMVVVDEAYVEFAHHAKGEGASGSLCGLVEDHDNLVVLRTFSKWAGLAGLRAGYGVFPAETARHIWKVKPPFNLNLAAEVAIRATLDDLGNVQRYVQLVDAERDRMAAALATLPGMHIWPSLANFVLVRVEMGSAADLNAHLARSGITVRAYSHSRLSDCLRISVGLPEHTDALIAAIEEWTETADERR